MSGVGWYLRQQAWWLRTKLALPMWRCCAATLMMTLVTAIVFVVVALAIIAVNP